LNVSGTPSDSAEADMAYLRLLIVEC
jgi:hypothetical protein